MSCLLRQPGGTAPRRRKASVWPSTVDPGTGWIYGRRQGTRIKGFIGFHRPEYLAGGRLNVGTGVLDYQGSGYAFGVRGLGAEGIEVANIEAMGEVYGLERLQDFPDTYVQAHQNHRRRSLVEECKRCDYAPCIEGRRDLDRGRRRCRV